MAFSLPRNSSCWPLESMMKHEIHLEQSECVFSFFSGEKTRGNNSIVDGSAMRKPMVFQELFFFSLTNGKRFEAVGYVKWVASRERLFAEEAPLGNLQLLHRYCIDSPFIDYLQYYKWWFSTSQTVSLPTCHSKGTSVLVGFGHCSDQLRTAKNWIFILLVSTWDTPKSNMFVWFVQPGSFATRCNTFSGYPKKQAGTTPGHLVDFVGWYPLLITSTSSQPRVASFHPTDGCWFMLGSQIPLDRSLGNNDDDIDIGSIGLQRHHNHWIGRGTNL